MRVSRLYVNDSVAKTRTQVIDSLGFFLFVTDFPMLLPMPAWNAWPILQQMLPVRPQGTCAQAVSSVSLRWQCHRMLGVD